MRNYQFRIHLLDAKDGDPMGSSEWGREECFLDAANAFKDDILSFDPQGLDHRRWEYVQIIPGDDYKEYWSGNAGAQGWMHRNTRWTIPDRCRQMGGYPEMWYRTRRWQLELAADSPIWDYIVIH